jgi:hypothetical protein
MNWKALLVNGTVQPHKTSTKEIEGLRQLIARDLADAAVEGLVDDVEPAVARFESDVTQGISGVCVAYRVE